MIAQGDHYSADPVFGWHIHADAAFVVYGNYSWPSYSLWLVPGTHKED